METFESFMVEVTPGLPFVFIHLEGILAAGSTVEAHKEFLHLLHEGFDVWSCLTTTEMHFLWLKHWIFSVVPLHPQVPSHM